MCPDNEILSAYIDGELEQGWHSKVAGHAAGCSVCQENEHRLRNVQAFLHSGDSETCMVADEAAIAVWRGVMRSRDRRAYYTVPFRRLRLSLTAIAVIGLVCAGLGALGMFYVTGGLQPGEASIAAIDPLIDQVDGFESVEELISYLEENDQGVSITIELPEDSVFMVMGEPQFLRTAEYRQGE